MKGPLWKQRIDCLAEAINEIARAQVLLGEKCDSRTAALVIRCADAARELAEKARG